MTTTTLPITHQWTLESMQLINWGCFDGYHPISFAGPGQVTLITGFTGTGKSTLLDAHIVLMHNTSTALNRASNATSHRSRSEETRNVVSYMRGVHGQRRDVDGEHDLLLREGPVWSAIAETWRSSTGAHLTALSAFFCIPSDTNRPHVRRDAWIKDTFDIRLLEQFARDNHVEAPFPPRAMEKAYPGLQVAQSTQALHRTLWKELDIGDEGDGKMAMDLLYKVQAADAVESVNDLFIRFVLDKPCTYRAADEAEKHFAKLRESRERVRVIDDQTARLARIPALWQAYQEGRDEAAFLTQVRLSIEPADTPFWKWRRDRECGALEEAELAATRAYRQAKADHETAKREADRILQQWSALAAAIAQHAGLAQLPVLDAEISAAQDRVATIGNTRLRLQEDLADIITLPDQRSGFDRQQTASEAFLSSYPGRAQSAEKRVTRAQQAQWRLAERRSQLKEERSHFEGRDNVVDQPHDLIRNRYAALVGIPADELPYAGELIDMLPEYEPWRMAAEKVLGATATSLLVPETHLASFRRAAETELTRYRIPYLTVRSSHARPGPADPATVVGRLQFRTHPYTDWLFERLSRTARHLCVDSPDDLGNLPPGHSDAVTLAGQTASRSGGMVGGQTGHRHTIGFSSTTMVDSIEAEIASVEQELGPADQAVSEARAAQTILTRQQQAHTALLATDWASIDHHSAQGDLIALQRRREALAADPSATTLLQQQVDLRTQLATANADTDGLAGRASELDERRAALMERKDAAWTHLEALDAVPDANPERLDELFATYRGDDDPDLAPAAEDFEDKAWAKFVRHLLTKQAEAARAGDTARDFLNQTFQDYLRDYPDNPGTADLTTDPDRSYAQYLAIYDRHLASGVEAAKADFTHYATDYGGHELTSLAMAYQTERDQILSRLGEINGALADQPFGETSTGRVSITLRDGHAPTQVGNFRAALTAATSGATRLLTYDQAVAKFTVFDDLISQMSDPTTRDTLLDVRRHIMLEAEHFDNGEQVSFHRGLGTKSGGESQELTMFIIAAAIRYRVGSIDAATPRFAPVFMDEGLIRADPARTRKAVDVWTRLGFQPIIASTADKHESISPTASVLLTVAKDARHRSRIYNSTEVPRP